MTWSAPSSGATAVIVGALGVVTGVPEAAAEIAPVPALFTARKVIE